MCPTRIRDDKMRTLTNLIAKVLIILISTIGVVSCGESPEDLFQKAVDYQNSGDYTKAVKLYKLLAEEGVIEAQHNLGVMYRLGQGVEQNYNEAAKWLTIAAGQGAAESQTALGCLYLEVQNYNKGIIWLELAAAQGYEDAINVLNSLGYSI